MVDCYHKRWGLRLAGLLLALGMAGAVPPGAFAQASMPEFEVDAVCARPEAGNLEQTRVDLYTKIPYARLRFISTPNGFKASYSVMVEAFETGRKDEGRNLVQRRLWDRTFFVENYASTQTPEFADRTTQDLLLDPGQYLLLFQIEDKHSNETFVRELPVTVRNLNKPVAVSDLILIDAHDVEKHTIEPSVSNRLGTDRLGLQLFYEVYTSKPQRVSVTREVMRTRKASGPPLMRTLLGKTDDEPGGEVSYTIAEPRRLSKGRNPFIVTIPMDDFKAGEYLIRVKVEDETGRLLDVAERALVAEWTGLAEHIQDLDEAVEQLSYIAKGKDVRHIRQAESKAERLKRFKEFWKKRDPTPGTERNEYMEEYYYRVANANRRYGTVDKGWKTDRGHVMVMFGEPDHVDRHPFNYNVKPYEVWYYYRIGRRFIFIDETGLGDYELLVPIYDERTRIR